MSTLALDAVRSAPPAAVVVAGWSGTAGAERALHSLRIARSGLASSITAVATLVVEPDGDVHTLEVRRAGHVSSGQLDGEALGVAADRVGRVLADAGRSTRGSSALVAVVEPALAGYVARALVVGGAVTTEILRELDTVDGAGAERVVVRSDAVVMRAL